MYGLSSRLVPLSAAEETVLLAIWRVGHPCMRWEIQEVLPLKEWANATLLNFLYRLEKKGWVKCDKKGNQNQYTALVSYRAYGVFTMRERLDTVFGGDVAGAITALISEIDPNVSSLERAKKALEEKLIALEDYDLYDPYD